MKYAAVFVLLFYSSILIAQGKKEITTYNSQPSYFFSNPPDTIRFSFNELADNDSIIIKGLVFTANDCDPHEEIITIKKIRNLLLAHFHQKEAPCLPVDTLTIKKTKAKRTHQEPVYLKDITLSAQEEKWVYEYLKAYEVLGTEKYIKSNVPYDYTIITPSKTYWRVNYGPYWDGFVHLRDSLFLQKGM